MRLVDRFDRRRGPGSVLATWDDAGVEPVVELTATMAAAWDPDAGDPRASASRAAVLGAFASAHAADSEVKGATASPLLAADQAPGIRRGGHHPTLALAFAGALLAVSLGAVVASAPGGILYETRVDAEALFLPGTPNDRARAEVSRLDARLADAAGASGRGDAAATDEALRAYARIATEAAAGPTVGPAVAADLQGQVEAQLVVLANLAPDRSTPTARASAMVAARALLAAWGIPGADPGSGPPGGPIGSPGTGPRASSPAASTTAPTRSHDADGAGSPPGPAGSSGAGPTGEPDGSGGQYGPDASPRPAGTSGPAPTARPTTGGSGGSSSSGGGGGATDPGAGGKSGGPGGMP